MYSDAKLDEMHAGASHVLRETVKVLEKHNLKYIMFYGSLLGTVRHGGFIPWDDDLDIAMPRADFEKFREIAKTELPAELFLQDYTTDVEYPAVVAKVRNSNTTLIENGYKYLRKMNHGIFMDIFVADFYEPSFANKIRLKLVHVFTGILLAQKVWTVNPVKKAVAKLFPRNLLFRRIEKMLKHLDCKNVGKHYLLDNTKVFDKSIFEDTVEMAFDGFNVCVPKEYDAILTSLYGDYMQFPPEEMQKPLHMTEHISGQIPYKEYIKENL